MLSEQNHRRSPDQTPGPQGGLSDSAAVVQTEPASEVPSAPVSRKLLFRVLSLLWLFPTAGAVWIWATESRGFRASPSLVGTLAAVTLEEWIGLVLVLLHVVFIGLAFRYRKME